MSETASTTTRVESVTQLTVSPAQLRTLLSGSHIVVDNHILNADNTATYLPSASIDTENFQSCEYVAVFRESDIQELLDDTEKSVLSTDETVELLKADDTDEPYFNRVTPTADDQPWDDTETTDLKQLDASEKEHVTMEVTMNVAGLSSSEREAINCLAKLYEDSFVEVCEKSRDYGWSFLTSGKKLSQSKGTPFDSSTRSQTFGVLTRTGDKRERIIENVFGDGSSTVSDEPHVTAQEAGNYYFMLSFILANPDLADAVSDV